VAGFGLVVAGIAFASLWPVRGADAPLAPAGSAEPAA